MPILNYTTTINASKTTGEITAMLAKHGANAVASYYENNEPSGIAFTIVTEYGPREFRLPANIGGVLDVLRKTRGVPTKLRTNEQATRVAWRILKDWVESQLAIIEAGMTRLDETMLPYMVMPNGATVSQFYSMNQGRLAIESGS